MRQITILFLLMLLFGCGSLRQTQSNASNPPAGPDGLKSKTTKVKKGSHAYFSDSIRVKGIMNYLASDVLEGRDAGSEGIEKAAEFIENTFVQNGIKPYFDDFKDTLVNFQKPAYNIVGVLKGSDKKLRNEYIIVGAHYDHIGIIKSENEDSIANGANDNASGTTTVMELARYFGASKSNKRSLIFVLFSAEEKGLLGSNHLAKKFKEEGLNLYLMLNFEMTGVPMVDKDYLMYVTGYDMSNLAEVSNKYANKNLVGFLPTAKEFGLFQRSDNFPFHNEFNIPSQTFCTFDFTNFNYYHKVGDEVGLMDFGHMAGVINNMIPVIEGFSNSREQEIKYY
ncbi:M28 family peptidase [uncultured Eudoraea sp.]|uniref:M28 family metallopeptidase n=1 Tax=uncultured Eudoraea sp. TaxID=1035614 RepID=UPI00262D1282|nr:M28 family peptidase [uncultured Eudoraea sp.]